MYVWINSCHCWTIGTSARPNLAPTRFTTAVRTLALWWHSKGKHMSHFIAETSIAETAIAETSIAEAAAPKLHRRTVPFRNTMLLSGTVVLTPTSRTCDQWRVANFGGMPVYCAFGQSFYPYGHPTCWASSQTSHAVSNTPCLGAWTSAPLSAHLSIKWECTESQISEQQLISSSGNNQSVALWLGYRWNAEWLESTVGLRTSETNVRISVGPA